MTRLFDNLPIGRRAAAATAGGLLATATLLGAAPMAGAGDAVPQCTVNHVKVERTAQGAAGHIVHDLAFTNISAESCTMRGFPGVDLHSTTGTTASVPRTADPYDTVQVNVGQTVHATVQTRSGDFPEGCNPVPIDSMWVTLPGTGEFVNVAANGYFCSAPGVATTSVTPVRA